MREERGEGGRGLVQIHESMVLALKQTRQKERGGGNIWRG